MKLAACGRNHTLVSTGTLFVLCAFYPALRTGVPLQQYLWLGKIARHDPLVVVRIKFYQYKCVMHAFAIGNIQIIVE